MIDEYPSTNPLYLGHVCISLDHDLFLDAIGYGLMSYFESGDVQQRQMSARALLRECLAILRDDNPRSWNLGFLLGQFAGMLNPDLQETDPRHTYLEALSQKCERLYGASSQKPDTAKAAETEHSLCALQQEQREEAV